jgi:hypothetical protein
MLGSDYQINKDTHPIYQVIAPQAWDRARFAKKNNHGDRVREEFHQILDQTIDDLLQKLALLYDAAMESPRAFQIISAKHIEKGLDGASEFIVENSKKKENLDYLTCKYTEAYSFVVIGRKKYQEQYGFGFSSVILSITTKGATFIENSVKKKLTPKKSVTWEEKPELIPSQTTQLRYVAKAIEEERDATKYIP